MAKRFEKPASGDAAGSKRNASGSRPSTKRSDKNSDGEKKVYNRREKPARSGDRPYRDKESYGKEGGKPRTGSSSNTGRGSRYAGKNDDRRSRSDEGAPRKTFGRKPFSKEGSDDRRRSGSDRPQRRDSFSKEGRSADRPRRSEGFSKEGRSADRPRRSEGFSKEGRSTDRPRRSEGFSKEGRSADRPRRSEGFSKEGRSTDRPYRGKSNTERSGEERAYKGKSFSDRTDKPFDKKGRPDAYSNRENRNSSDDRRPSRPYQSRKSDSESFSEKRGENFRSDNRGDKKPFGQRDNRPFKKEFTNKEEGSRRNTDNPEQNERFNRNKEVLSRFKNNRAEVSAEEAPNYKIKPFRSKRVEKAVDKEEKDGKIRLNRYIANAGICSRREADSLISSGEIKVNGEIVTEMGYLVNPSDNVQYGRKVLNRQKMVYVLLNKPKDFITTTEDPEGRKTVMDLVGNATDERIFPVGRLDRNTTGLLLFTNDGELAQKLTHPTHKTGKIYQVELDKPITNEDFKKITEGLELEDGKAEVDDIAVLSADKKFLGLEIHIGRNRIVRRIFEHLGYDVVTLDRVQFASLTKKDLPRGKWRFLNEKEVIRLKYFM